MAVNLNAPMTDEEIKLLDYFEKAQLYHNVYESKTYYEIPVALRKFFTEDQGLQLVKATISSANIKNPYEIARLIKSLAPSKPHTHQEIYGRAAYLANVCDTSIEKILRSNLFYYSDFIPQLKEDSIKEVLNGGTAGLPIPLESEEYTPAPVDPTPTPTPTEGEKKIYFSKENNNIVCDTAYSDVIADLPKLPEAEFVLDANSDYQNILNISCGYNEISGLVDFNFIQTYEDTIKFFTIHYGSSSITMEENVLNIEGGLAS